jgi:hypothetical protein
VRSITFFKIKEDPLHLATLWYDSEIDAKESFEWEKRSFQKFVVICEKRNSRWPGYWVLLLKRFRVLSRGGGKFQCILNARPSFFWF